MLTVVVYKWYDPHGRWNDRYLYSAEMVNNLQKMVSRNLKLPHKFVCVTDDSEGVHPSIPCFSIPNGLIKLGYRFPKLSLFDPKLQNRMGGDKFLCLDLDCVITNDITDLITPGPFRIWGGTSKHSQYNSSMMLLNHSAKYDVWKSFEASRAFVVAHKPDIVGSDQVWIRSICGPNVPMWSYKDGVLSFKRDVDNPGRLPKHSKIVFFNGGHNLYSEEVQRKHGWIKKCLP